MSRIVYIGGDDSVGQALATAFGAVVQRELPAAPADEDVYFLQAFAGSGDGALAGLPGGNAFAACRAIKASSRARVFVLVRAADATSAEVARFCLADGAVPVEGGRLLEDPAALASRAGGRRPRPAVDDLLRRLERDLAAGGDRHATALRRIASASGGDALHAQLTDADTGLYGGAFASLKLDEEFKRAKRFHQPLSLVLLDIAPRGALPADEPARRMALAEVAGVFLNECRDIDVLARFSEHVFLFLLPGTGTEGASVVTRRILGSLRARPFGGVPLEPAAGVTCVPAAGIHDREAFLVRGEACLLLAKDGGGQGGMFVDRE